MDSPYVVSLKELNLLGIQKCQISFCDAQIWNIPTADTFYFLFFLRPELDSDSIMAVAGRQGANIWTFL